MRRRALVAGGVGALAAALVGSGAAKTPPGTVQPHTLPGLAVPLPRVVHPAATHDPGYLFVAPKGDGVTGGPEIVDDRGRVVWYHQLAPPLQATDFRVQRYRGRPVLTFWVGTTAVAGFGKGHYEIWDASYRRIATVRAPAGLAGDLHEFQLTPRGTAYFVAYHEVRGDLSGVGGPRDSWIENCVVLEVDVATGKVVWRWSALDHVPLAESVQANREPAQHASKKRGFDYFHANSVSDGPGGTVLVSARNASAIYDVARDGRIVWRLGGKGNDFSGVPKFGFQHASRWHAGGVLSFFDNGGIPRIEPHSHPYVLRVDAAKRHVTVLRDLQPPRPLASPYEGDVDLHPDGSAVVGWGGVPRVSVFAPNGRERLQLKLPYGDTYRAWGSLWAGRPGGRPLAVVAGGGVYASWNGETGIARWRLSGPRGQRAPVGWAGLETTLGPAPPGGGWVVQALDARGRVLGTSKPL